MGKKQSEDMVDQKKTYPTNTDTRTGIVCIRFSQVAYNEPSALAREKVRIRMFFLLSDRLSAKVMFRLQFRPLLREVIYSL